MCEEERARTVGLSRRELLAGASGFALGVATASLGGGLSSFLWSGPALAAEKAQPTHPFPYVRLDPEVALRRGYEGFWEGYCSYGCFKAILSQLREKIGFPYTGVPYETMKYGVGGYVGWGTLCGALNGAGAAISLCVGQMEALKVINELVGWYTTYEFPSDRMDSFAKVKNQVRCSVGSPLCHVSVGKWVNKAGVKVNSPEHNERCAKLTGDVAHKAVELLNAIADGTFVAAYDPPETLLACMSCHSGPGTRNDVMGAMDCMPCHADPHGK
ncbi:MAG: C-GCAxxG-C-C family (seleno)protein [Betaproteobacteria bacterium]